ncbi:olfactory receptor 10A7-like [Tachyglossus aculeatus]|uniref:olfactory receptor 10A7-like n=1 Tax=Tachyglossus aculeatus TaxID=9261 RepID=UPI0018F6D019|nr:olfactory receptor 10A7-like [Tachyglossus aculeatus]
MALEFEVRLMERFQWNTFEEVEIKLSLLVIEKFQDKIHLQTSHVHNRTVTRSLSLMDIGYTTVIPQMLTNFLSNGKGISLDGCAAQMYFAFFFGSAECGILTTMACDRHATSCDLLHYSLIMNRRFCLKLPLSSWLSVIPVATIQTAMMFSLPFCGPNVINHFFCDSPPLLDLVCTDKFTLEIYSVAMTVIDLMLPFGMIVVYYVCILITILKMSSTESYHKAFSTS